MQHQTGEKFNIKGADLNIEISGCFPGGQGRTLSIRENSYQITINGVPMDITESHLELLKNSVKKENKK
jgi:ribosomal protein L24